jgi:GTP-binding protein EngB required for normal cell division
VRDFQAWKSSSKMDYLETQKKLLLVSKIVDKKRSLAQVEEENLNLKTVEELNIKLRELHCLHLTWN